MQRELLNYSYKKKKNIIVGLQQFIKFLLDICHRNDVITVTDVEHCRRKNKGLSLYLHKKQTIICKVQVAGTENFHDLLWR